MWFVVRVVNGRERRVFSRHRKQECARKAATKLRIQSGITGVQVVFRGDPAKGVIR